MTRERPQTNDHGPDRPVENPATSLSPPALELLDAARSLLLNGGYDALRLEAIVSAAGMNKASVRYYFGNKEGLVFALVDSLDHDQCVALEEATRTLEGGERIRRYIDGQTSIGADADAYRMFFDVLPHAIRNATLRARVAQLYDWYRQMNLAWLGVEHRVDAENRRAFESFAALMVAIVDGLALQAALDPDGVDAAGAFQVLEFLLRHSFDDLAAWLQGGGVEANAER